MPKHISDLAYRKKILETPNLDDYVSKNDGCLQVFVLDKTTT